MLKEYPLTTTDSGSLLRRWFFDDYFDLTIWFSSENRMVEFRLLYDLGPQAHSLRWNAASPDLLIHELFDDGESVPGKYKRMPVLCPPTRRIPTDLHQSFLVAATNLEVRVRDEIVAVLKNSAQH
jgi:hypothetical protein